MGLSVVKIDAVKNPPIFGVLAAFLTQLRENGGS